MNTYKFNQDSNKILDIAIKNKSKVLINYYSLKNQTTERIISNIEYSNEFEEFGYYRDHIKAYCHLRNDERHFKIDRIKSIEILEENIINNLVKNKEETINHFAKKTYTNINKEVSPQKSCFISTHIYGINSPKTLVLRVWRDDFLKRSLYGRVFIKFYYMYSKFVVRIMERYDFADKFARILLNSVVRYVLKKL